MKKFLSFITAIFIFTLSFPSIAKADTSVDSLYKDAYNATMEVTSLATEYGIVPYDTVKNNISRLAYAVDSGLQVAIVNARTKINLLPSSIQNMKNTLSSILDTYQHTIYAETVTALNYLSTIEMPKVSLDVNLMPLVDFCSDLQSDAINPLRTMIKDMPMEFRSSFSSEVDKYQQKLINTVLDFLQLTEETGNDSFIFTMKIMLIELAEDYDIPKDMKDYYGTLSERVSTLKYSNFIGWDAIQSLTEKYGFISISSIDVNDKIDSSKIYTDVFSEDFVKILTINGSKKSLLESKEFFETLLPIQNKLLMDAITSPSPSDTGIEMIADDFFVSVSFSESDDIVEIQLYHIEGLEELLEF